ncbi:Crp/Fnr family transcriptional regulator [Olivibacter domesticus]|uniref:cAMP-binding domain of CRP or a regulatory subunit of cAMP-dependent protein kinases n=1 Tax=Olivibacter domesticus TaxID=407022 RepID=A0A1H7H7X4_OLID1|nr:Crp/Fnr family transcriptional regulator [Olivibacter domesticus]SEK45402.1 cAMP-binding domain of CRP or a regulatory subunit of cAMP-dependent protein kinases [Olivibacter domesticus]
MLTEFEHYLATQANLPNEAIRKISTLAMPRILRRNEFIFRAGEICRHKIFIVNGLLRTFNTTTAGNEHILQFSPELTWTLDVESYDRQIPSYVSIAAVEPSNILLWHKSTFNTLLTEIPAFKKLAEQLISRNIYHSRQRMLTILSGTPEEKYADFIRNYPGFLSRLPLRMIAAYLGISIKTLTRIRHTQLQR